MWGRVDIKIRDAMGCGKETKRPFPSPILTNSFIPSHQKLPISIMKNYRAIGDDEESSSTNEQHEQQQARLEAFALKRNATIGVCVYAAAIASTRMVAYSRHGFSSVKTNENTKAMDLHAVKTAMKSTDFTRLNQQVEAMLDQKQAANHRKLIGGPAGAQAKADAAVAGVSSSSATSSSSSGSKSSVLTSPAVSTATPPQGTSGTSPLPSFYSFCYTTR